MNPHPDSIELRFADDVIVRDDEPIAIENNSRAVLVRHEIGIIRGAFSNQSPIVLVVIADRASDRSPTPLSGDGDDRFVGGRDSFDERLFECCEERIPRWGCSRGC